MFKFVIMQSLFSLDLYDYVGDNNLVCSLCRVISLNKLQNFRNGIDKLHVICKINCVHNPLKCLSILRNFP